MHGIIWTDKIDIAVSKWKYGFMHVGDYVNSRTVNYCVKYVSKIDLDHYGYKPRVLSSKGIGKYYVDSYNAQQNT